MICRYAYLRRYPSGFLQRTVLRVQGFADLLTDLLPRIAAAEHRRLTQSARQRARGGGRHADLMLHDQMLLTGVWVRQYPTNEL